MLISLIDYIKHVMDIKSPSPPKYIRDNITAGMVAQKGLRAGMASVNGFECPFGDNMDVVCDYGGVDEKHWQNVKRCPLETYQQCHRAAYTNSSGIQSDVTITPSECKIVVECIRTAAREGFHGCSASEDELDRLLEKLGVDEGTRVDMIKYGW